MDDLASAVPGVSLADDVVIVLVQPQHPGNIGSSARAMANMGLRRLVVVDPSSAFDPEQVAWMAPGSDAVLRGMRVVGTLDEALEGVHRVIGTTARHRARDLPVIEPAAVAEQVFARPGRVTAILFGREDSGLSADDTLRCEALLRIATDHHASLNLAAAVLIVAHHLFEEGRRQGHVATGREVRGRRGVISTRTLAGRATSPRADVAVLEPVVGSLTALLERVGFTRGIGPERVASTLREGMQRADLSQRHVKAMRGMIRRVVWALDHPEAHARWWAQHQAGDAAAHPEGDGSDDAG